MTPQERQLVSDLFDRLASLETEPRDPEAERLIAEGLRRAPHAIYPLVQTVLLQDEALRAADEQMREMQGGAPAQGSFLDTMRDALFGRRDDTRTSVPSVRPGASGPFRMDRNEVAAPQGGGGSFLGTAAASAAGVIGGALLMNMLRPMFGGGSHQSFGDGGALGGSERTPWDQGAGNSDLARQAGVEDIGRGGNASGESQRAGLFDSAQADLDDDDSDSGDDADGDFDFGGDSDIA